MNNNGIRIVDILPIPLSTSRTDTTQKIPHKTSVQINVGTINVAKLAKLELPPTLFMKNEEGSLPHPKLKLFRRYTKSHPNIIM